MREEALKHTFRCGIQYCAHTLTLNCEPRHLIDDAAKRGWKYVYTWESIHKSDSSPWICEECWRMSGLKWRTDET